MKRLNTQHRMMLLALGGLYPDNYTDNIRRRLKDRDGETIEIADLGSGSGDWISDMAKEFPHARGIGIDLAPSMPIGVAPNVSFETRDVTKGMAEHDDKYDMVHTRSIANGISDYPAFIATMARMLKPGGILMLMEGHLQVYDEELNIMQSTSGIPRLLAEIVARQASPNNLGINKIGDRLEFWMQEHGEFTDIRTHAVYVPIGWSGSPEHCKEPVAAGRLMMENMQNFAGAWHPMFISMGVPEVDIDQWVSEARRQLENPGALRAYTKWSMFGFAGVLDKCNTWIGTEDTAGKVIIYNTKQCGGQISFHRPFLVLPITVMNALRAAKATASTSRAFFATRAASTVSGVPPIRSSTSAVPLANVEAQWSGLSAEEQVEVHRELEELQKRDWKTLSIDEKKA
ncbi:hypothetical protein FRC09_018653, partial [Ceratobasidium sp. 395]